MLKILTKAATLRGVMGRVFCLLFVAAVIVPAGLIISPVSAQAPPSLPAIFYGTVTVSGSPATSGTVVQAQISSVIRGSFTVTSSGSYGNMLVTDGNSGDIIQFWVNGVAAQTGVYNPGERNLINLSTGGGGSAPSAPVLSSPASGATGVSITPTLQWTASSGATSYAVQVSTSASFSTIAFSQSSITGTSVAVSTALTAGTLYYWRANATNTYGTSSWATVWSFTTASTAAPSAPTLISPSNGATGVANSPMLQWSPSTNATSYIVQVSTSNTFSSTVFSQSGSATAVTVTPALSNSITYYWRANATGTGGTSSWSSTWSFTTSGGSTPSVPAFFKGIAYNNGSAVYLKQVCASTATSGSSCASSDALGNYLVSVNGSPGDAVTFTVDGSTAVETGTFSPGWMTGLDLHAGTGVLAVTTGSGTYATTTAAILNGALASFGATDTSAAVSFDWGTTASYGNTTTPTTLATTTSFTGSITGLTAGVTYYYRAKAVGSPSGVTVYGSGMTYVHNSGGTLSVTTGSGSYLTTSTATLTSTLAGLASDTSATCYIDYGLTTSYGSSTTGQVLTSTGSYSGTASGLTVGQTYYIRGRVVGSPSGTTAYGSDLTYVHASGGTLAVTTGSGSYLTATTATLTSTLTGKGTDTSATCYIDYGLTTSYGNSTTGQVLTSTSSYSGTASGLTAGQTYHLRGRVVGSPSGSTVYGTDVTYVHNATTGDPIGSTAGTSATYGLANRAYFCKYTATATTNITKIKVYFIGAGNAKVAIYSNNGGMVGSLIQSGEGTVTGAGITSFTITAAPIVSGTSYWLAAWSDSPIIGFAATTGTIAYFDQAAPFTFPSPISFITYAGTISWRGMLSGGN